MRGASFALLRVSELSPLKKLLLSRRQVLRWTRKSIIEEIRRMKSAREELNYSSVEREHLNLTRAAAWHFGSWRGAVEAAGIEYDDIRKYRRWSRERVLGRIRELHQAGADLNWRAVSTSVDPPLAAAALRIGDFATWRAAIAAAGLDIESVARYRYWDEARVLAALRAAKKRGDSLSSKAAQQRDQPLFCAARRRFGTWNNALESAGIAPQRMRYEGRENAAASGVSATAKKSAAKKSAAPNAASTRSAKTARAAATSAPAKVASAQTTATKKEISPNAASTRGANNKTASSATAAKSALKSGAAKTTSATKVSTAKAPVAKAPVVKTPVTKTAAAAAKAPAAKAPVAKTSASNAAPQPAAAKNAKRQTSRAAKK